MFSSGRLRPEAEDEGGFCWDSLPSRPALLAGAPRGYGPGAAALSARLAQQHASSRASAFEFESASQVEGTAVPLQFGQPRQRLAAAPALHHADQMHLSAHSVQQSQPRPAPPQRQPRTAPAKHPASARPSAAAAPASRALQAAAAERQPRGGAAAATTAAAVAPAAKTGPPVSTSMSLERYLEFRSHLTKGGSRVGALSELEKSVLKMNDLKQILLINGCALGNKTKAEALESLRWMELLNPCCCIDLPEAAPALAQGPSHVSIPPLDAHMLESLGWASLSQNQLQLVQHSMQTGLEKGPNRVGGYSCCNLPPVTIRFPPGAQGGSGSGPQMLQQPVAGATLAAVCGCAPGMQACGAGPARGVHMGAWGSEDLPGGITLPASLLQPTPEQHTGPLAAMDVPIGSCRQQQQQQQEEEGISGAGQVEGGVTMPADSDLTVASGQPRFAGILGSCTAEVMDLDAAVAGQAAAGTGSNSSYGEDQAGPAAAPGEKEPAEEDEGGDEGSRGEQLPEWLVAGVARIAERSQASSEQLSRQELVGRKVAFSLLVDFRQSDDHGIVDTVLAGMHEGQVAEFLSDGHDPDTCEPDCTQPHAFFSVRVPVDRTSSASASWGRQPRRLYMELDLEGRHQAADLEDLLSMGQAELQDAWVLLEPLSEGNQPLSSGAAAAAAATQQPADTASAAVTATPWRSSKRPGRGIAEDLPPSKAARVRQQQPAEQQGVQVGEKSRGGVGNRSSQADAVQGQQAAAGGRATLVWASFGGMWWPAQVLEGSLGGTSNVRVEVFGCNLPVKLDPSKVVPFHQDRAARIAKQQQSDLGRKAVERALQLERGG